MDKGDDDIEDVADVRLASPLLAPSSSAAVEETFGFGKESPEERKERMRSLSIIYFLGSVLSLPAIFVNIRCAFCCTEALFFFSSHWNRGFRVMHSIKTVCEAVLWTGS